MRLRQAAEPGKIAAGPDGVVFMIEKLLHEAWTWTRAEAYALQGRRIRFADGHDGTVRNVVELKRGGTVYCYAVEATPDGDMTLQISKHDAAAGWFVFTLLPDPPVPEQARLSLPEWGRPV